MTEEEWLACADPKPMLVFLRGKASDRKLRLFACACCRRIWHLLIDERSRTAVEVAERFADGKATKKERKGKTTKRELKEAYSAAHMAIGFDSEWNLVSSGPTVFAAVAASSAADDIAFWAAAFAADNVRYAAGKATEEEKTSRWLTGVLRDISGDPFRLIPFQGSWLTPHVTSLAQATYDDRQLPSGLFDNQRMGVLADALEDAGCTDEQVLVHLRGPSGPHVRGCWAVDLLLGKE
jgi:hypothetical protein